MNQRPLTAEQLEERRRMAAVLKGVMACLSRRTSTPAKTKASPIGQQGPAK